MTTKIKSDQQDRQDHSQSLHRDPVRARVRVAPLAASFFSVALAACNGAAPDAGDPNARESVSAVAAALQVTPGPTAPAQPAAGVELYVQAPFDFDNGALDLDDLDDVNLDPVVSQRLAIPYDSVETTLAAQLAALTAKPISGQLEGPLGSHVLWSVGLSASARFSQRGQPVLHPWGSAANNGVHVDLDTQLEVELNAHVHIHATAEWIPDPEDFDVPMHALIGGHGRVDLAFFPVVRADNLQAWATLDQCDVDIVGLDGTAITAGAVIGAGIGWVTGGSIVTAAFLGAITADAVLDEAKDRAKDVILKKAAQAFESSRDKLTAVVNAAVQPKVAQANDVLARIRNQPIPGLGRTLGQLEDQFGMSLDIRSLTRDGTFRTAFTARFANVPAQGTITGRLRFPKQRCEYAMMANRLTGELMMATGIAGANGEMAETGCAGVDVASLLHRVYYGANPDAVLESGAPENNLTTWAGLGSVQVGTMEEDADSYECPFTINGLPDAAFVDVRPALDSALLHALSNRRMGDGTGGDQAGERLLHLAERMGQGRFVLATAGGVSIVLDHTGEAPAVVEIGTHGPASLQDCPSLGGGSSGGVELGFDPSSIKPGPDNCPSCGAVEDPGDNVIDETTLGDDVAHVDKVVQVDDGAVRETPAAGVEEIAPGAGIVAGTHATATPGLAGAAGIASSVSAARAVRAAAAVSVTPAVSTTVGLRAVIH